MGRSKAHASLINPGPDEGFRNLPANVLFLFNGRDIKGAKPKSPGKCIAARCIMRSTGARRAVVLLTVAYLEMDLGDGWYWYMGRVPADMRLRVIEPLDRDEAVPPGTFTIRAPAKGETLEANRARSERQRALRHERIAQGLPAVKTTTRHPGNSKGINADIRNGAGLVRGRRLPDA